MNDFLSGWLKSESAEHDKISVKRIYIDINGGNLYDGVLFSQIMYWHGRSMETGKRRLTIKHDGHLWLAKRNEDWYAECRIDESTARKSIGRMIERGLIIKAVYHFSGVPTTHIRVDADGFEKAIKAICPDVADKAETEPSLIRPDIADGFDLSGQMVLTSQDSSYNTDTLPETTPEIKDIPATAGNAPIEAPKPKRQRKGKDESVPRPEFNAMCDAIVAAHKYPEIVWKTNMAGIIRDAAKTLCLAGYKPEHIARIHAYCVKQFKDFTPAAMAKHAVSVLDPSQSNGRTAKPAQHGKPDDWTPEKEAALLAREAETKRLMDAHFKKTKVTS